MTVGSTDLGQTIDAFVASFNDPDLDRVCPSSPKTPATCPAVGPSCAAFPRSGRRSHRSSPAATAR
jgi:hypothetical protein